MITLQKIEDRYQRALEGISFNQNIHTAEHPSHATWIHTPTLAKWAYMSTCEFVNEFKSAVQTYLDQPGKRDQADILSAGRALGFLIEMKSEHRNTLLTSGLANQYQPLMEVLKA